MGSQRRHPEASEGGGSGRRRGLPTRSPSLRWLFLAAGLLAWIGAHASMGVGILLVLVPALAAERPGISANPPSRNVIQARVVRARIRYPIDSVPAPGAGHRGRPSARRACPTAGARHREPFIVSLSSHE